MYLYLNIKDRHVKTQKNRVTCALTKVTRSYNPAIDYIIILPLQGPVLRVLPVLPVLLRVLPVLRVLLPVLPVLRVLQPWGLLLSVPACSLLLRLIKKPIKAR